MQLVNTLLVRAQLVEDNVRVEAVFHMRFTHLFHFLTPTPQANRTGGPSGRRSRMRERPLYFVLRNTLLVGTELVEDDVRLEARARALVLHVRPLGADHLQRERESPLFLGRDFCIDKGESSLLTRERVLH